MSASIEIVRNFSPTERSVFVFIEYDLGVRLYRYRFENRQTTRHGWKSVHWWDRLDPRGNNIKLVSIPKAVADEAVTRYRDMVKLDTEGHEVVE